MNFKTSFLRINDGFDDTRAVGHAIPFYRHCLHETSAEGLGQSGGIPFGKRLRRKERSSDVTRHVEHGDAERHLARHSEMFWLLDRANARGPLKFDHQSPPCTFRRTSLFLNEGGAGFARHTLGVVDGKVVAAWNGVDSLKTFQQMEAVVTGGGIFRPQLRQNTSR